MDVVPVPDVSLWNSDPFEMTRDENDPDKLCGRGTTDCLGHVALVACIFKQLCLNKVELDVTLYGVLIASEESASHPVKNAGVEYLVEKGMLEPLKKGPIVWVDSADSEPCIGTAGALQWTLKADGKLCHSGLPHKGINALELVNEACKILQDKFYAKFPAHAKEKLWLFGTPSTMKPTQCQGMAGSINQVPDWAVLRGDIRVTPFYEVADVKEQVEAWVKELNDDIKSNKQTIPVRGTHSKYILPDENKEGRLSIEWGESVLTGVACDIESKGFFAVCEAFQEVRKTCTPYSICGSLPLVAEMKAVGFDLQITGFGKSAVYHADNEYCSLKDMENAFKVLCRIVGKVNDDAWCADYDAGKKNSADHMPEADGAPLSCVSTASQHLKAPVASSESQAQAEPEAEEALQGHSATGAPSYIAVAACALGLGALIATLLRK